MSIKIFSNWNEIRFAVCFSLLILLTLLYAAHGHVYWWGWPALSYLIALNLFFKHSSIGITPLFMAIGLYALVMLANQSLVNPVFHAEGLYFVVFLVTSFLLGRRLKQEQFIILYKSALFVFAILSVWAVGQYLTGLGFLETQANNRANTVFTTPNSFAATLNLVLIPLLVARMCRVELKKYDWLILLLFAALLASQSRGGWIAFMGGIGLITPVLLFSKQIKINKQLLVLAAKLIVLATIFVVYHQSETNRSVITRANISAEAANMTANTVQFSTIEHRLHFYRIAWDQFLEKPVLGNGYFNYKYYLDRDNTPELARKGTTHFVHNDYLQHLLETGLVGFACLLLLVCASYFQLWKLFQSTSIDVRVICFSISASLTAFYIHALGDFVFYPPTIVLLYGITLGAMDRLALTHGKLDVLQQLPCMEAPRSLAIKRIALIMTLLICLTPVIGRQYALAANEARSSDEYTKAFTLVKTAQLFAPYEAGYKYIEAQLWLDAVRIKQTKESATVADQKLNQALSLNPYDKYLLLELSKLHRDYSNLLDKPADISTILAWQEEVLEWQNHNKNNAAQTEYIKSLTKAGRIDEARALYAKLQQEIMEHRGVKNLLRQIYNPDT